jgi:RNA recognition motif-containing protein
VLNANAAGAAGVAGLLSGAGGMAPGGVAAGPGQDVKARKLYVGNLPLDLNVTEQTMKDFFDTAMTAAFPEMAETPGKPVEQVWMSGEKKFCFVTFRNEDEAMKGMQLDNIQLMGRPLRIGRPSDYVPPAGQAQPQPLSATGTNNMPLGAPGGAPAAAAPAGAAGAPAPTSVVLRLTNTMTEAEVDDDEEYNDIKEDMLEECGKFGKVESLEMPKEGPGKTMVFVKFDSLESAAKGFSMLHGRSFETRVVEASYFPQDKFDAKEFS